MTGLKHTSTKAMEIAILATLELSLIVDPDFQTGGYLNLGILALCAWQLSARGCQLGFVMAVILLATNLVQSGLLNWMALGVPAMVLLARRSTAPTARPWLWLALFAAWQPWIAVLILKWGSQWILALDARWTAFLLTLVGYEVQAVGNLIQTQVHSVLVLVGCSSIHGLAEMGLITAACGVWLNAPRRNLRLALCLAIVCAVAANGLRLASMTLSPELQVWWHEPTGETVYQSVMGLIFVVLVLTQFVLIRGPGPGPGRKGPQEAS